MTKSHMCLVIVTDITSRLLLLLLNKIYHKEKILINYLYAELFLQEKMSRNVPDSSIFTVFFSFCIFGACP